MARRNKTRRPHRPGPAAGAAAAQPTHEAAAGAAAAQPTHGPAPAGRSRDLPAAREQHGPGAPRGPVAWLGAFSPQDGPAVLVLALLVAVSYFPALQAASCGTT